MRPTIYTIDRPGPGTISTMARPRGDRWLRREMRGLRALGVDILVCAMEPAERDECGLTNEAEAALGSGIRFVEIPIPDRTTPDRAAIADTITHLAGEYRAGKHIAFHCWAGIGRSSLLAAAVLVEDGVDPDEAWDLISAARGYPVPDTEEQRVWLTG